jgi:choline dehydrogenase-like flavoprotein
VARQALDVVVAGAGSTGSAVAARLSEEPSRSVLLLEAGPDFPDAADSPPAFLVGGNLLGHGFAGAGLRAAIARMSDAAAQGAYASVGRREAGDRRISLICFSVELIGQTLSPATDRTTIPPREAGHDFRGREGPPARSRREM